MPKLLESATIKLGQVASAALGVRGKLRLRALAAGETAAEKMSHLARRTRKRKQPQWQQALEGRVTPAQRGLLGQLLDQSDHVEAARQRAEARIGQEVERSADPCVPEAVKLLDTIPGVGETVAQIIGAEIGVDMTRFPTDHHLASGAGRCPGNNESGGKRKSGQTRHGSPWLRKTLIEAAHAAACGKQGYLTAQYHRLAARRGKKKAVVAVGQTLLVIVYHMLTRQEEYQELGGNYFDERDKQAVTRRLVQRLQKLGYDVSLQPAAIAA